MGLVIETQRKKQKGRFLLDYCLIHFAVLKTEAIYSPGSVWPSPKYTALKLGRA
jgi:hypothetical protein